MTAIQKMIATKRRNTNRRYSMIQRKFNELAEKRVEGMRLNIDDVIQKVADEFGIEAKTVEVILKKRISAETITSTKTKAISFTQNAT